MLITEIRDGDKEPWQNYLVTVTDEETGYTRSEYVYGFYRDAEKMAYELQGQVQLALPMRGNK